MVPINPNNTPRFRVHYAAVGQNHTIQFRSHNSPGAMGTFIAGLFNALAAAIVPCTISFVDWAATGSDIFNPVVTGVEGNVIGTSPVQPEFQAYALSYVGRTAGGRRNRVAIFGVNSLGSNYRFSAGESAVVDAGRAHLVANPGYCVGIDDLTTVWKAYGNVKPWDHWVDHVR